MVVGVTPRTRLIASRVKPSSAMIWSLVRVVRSLWDQVWTLIPWPDMYSSTKIVGLSITREPTTKKVALISFWSR